MTLRPLIPALAVAGVLVLSFLAPPQLIGATSAVGYGYGYANNCGVKGDGFHDHGKACPNRPFPGKGKGVMEKILGIVNNIKESPDTGQNTTSPDSDVTTTSGGGDETTGATVTTEGTTPATGAEQDTQSTGRGHGKGHGHVNGHNQG